MSYINKNLSDKSEGRSSQLVIISKNRLSSARNNENFLTIQEGNKKYRKLIKGNLSRQDINQTISTIKNEMTKNSKSYITLNYEANKLDLYLKKKKILLNDGKKLNISNSEKKKINNLNIPASQLKSIVSIETTKSGNIIKTSDNNNDNDNNNEGQIKIKELKTIEKNEKNDILDDDIKNISADSIEIKDENSNSNNNNLIEDNFVNLEKKIISQNYFNMDNKHLKNIDKRKSEEIYKKNLKRINEKDIKRDYNDKNCEQSDKAMNDQVSKRVFDSLMVHKIGENNEIENYNVHQLRTENGEEKSNRGDLISENKELKKKEDEEKDNDECEVVDDEEEYDEKIKNDNNRKEVSNYNIKNINNFIKENNNNINNNTNNNNVNNPDVNIKKIKNELKEQNENKRNIIKSLNINPISNNNIYKMCEICEHTYNFNKLFVAKCEDHYICKRCTKNYYEEAIEEGKKGLFCPFLSCKEEVDKNKLKNFISSEHYNRLCSEQKKKVNNENKENKEEKKGNFYFTKLKTNINKENIEKYTKKNVIDINSNKNFFNYNSAKDGYCPYCYEESLFSKTNTHYYKCLNCLSKICKYCFKEYHDRHMDINYPQHCKVFYRGDEEDNKKKSIFETFLLELFFVCATFYLCLAGSFYSIKKLFFGICNINYKSNFMVYFFGYFFVFIFFIITIPFIVILYPYFPSVIALCDY